MRCRLIWRWDDLARVLRVLRLTWTRGVVGDGHGYSAKLTLALTPRLWRAHCSHHSRDVTLLGVRLHYDRSYGGIYSP